ncbi:MAG: hypothetical protein ACEQSR_12890 [Candidatus Methylacidiphilales bacterium]
MARLRYYLRHYQPKNKLGQNIVYSGTNPNNLIEVLGNVPIPNYIEITDDVDDDRKFTVTFKMKKGENSEGASNIEQAASSELTFSGNTYKLINEWLNNSVSAALNGIEIKVRDEECNTEYTDFIVFNHGIRTCTSNNVICEVQLNLRQRNEIWECLQKTSITDNHAGMFDEYNVPLKHPRFAYCNELRPAGLLTSLFFVVFLLAFIMFVVLAPIIVIVTAIVVVLNALIWLTGGTPIQAPISFGLLHDMFDRIFIDIGGCGHEETGVLIRDYVKNVCDKCGIQVDQNSFPIYFDPSSPYYNGAMISSEVKKGPERDNTDRSWIKDNDPLLTLDMLLDSLKPIHNAKWFTKGNTLYFDRKDKMSGNAFIFDFINTDANEIEEGPCFTWSEDRPAAFGRYEYQADGFDNIASDAKRRYNAIVEFNKPNNPLYKGTRNVNAYKFAPTRFRGDGIYKDYVEQALAPLQALSGFTLVLYPFYLQARNRLKEFRGAILQQNHTLMLNKLVVWDGVSLRNSRVKWVYDYINNPPVNAYYNTTALSYQQVHLDDKINDGAEINRLYNFDYCFEEMFLNNLYDRFHQIDDPRIKVALYKNFDIKISLCCNNVERLNLQNNADTIVLEQKLKIDAGQYYKEGVIEEIELDYEARQITLKGRI